jgi:FKBP-type peptidyl-prolyl cis-trans isomerase
VPKLLLKTGVDSLSYAIGMNIGANMKVQGINNLTYTALNKGIADAMKENPAPLMNQDQCNITIQQKLQEYAAKKNFAVKEEGRKFLEQNKKQPGVVVLPSGVQYKIIKQGNGVKPLVEDTVVAHYKGSTIDGNVFQESFTSGQPLVYPLSNLVAGWQQVVVLMPAGSKWQLFIPSEFAYGERGSGADIPGGATLIFEIELLDVKPLKK